MSQCVPSWDLDDNPVPPPRQSVHTCSNSQSHSSAHDVPMPDYEVAELTWENGQLSMHGFGLPRVSSKPQLCSPTIATTKYPSLEKPRASGTLESIVSQASIYSNKPSSDLNLNFQGAAASTVVGQYNPAVECDNLVPWISPPNHHHHRTTAVTTPINTTTVDALVPSPPNHKIEDVHSKDIQPAARHHHHSHHRQENDQRRGGTCVVGCSTRVGSCSGAPTYEFSGGEEVCPPKTGAAAGIARVPVATTGQDWSVSRDQQSVSLSGSATFGMDSHSQQLTIDTCDKDLGTTRSFGSAGNTTSPGTNSNTGAPNDHDSVCHSRPQRDLGDTDEKKKSTSKSVSTKRSRAAAVHNQSERKRRDKINQRMKTLQKLVPNSSKTDKASMLDEVIEYLKQLQAQIHMFNGMSFPLMMMPLAMQQQMQMSMMAMSPMGMGLGMNLNPMARSNMAAATGMPPVMSPQAFMAGLPTWESSSAAHHHVSNHDSLQSTRHQAPVAPAADPLSAYLASTCQPQPMNMDAYSRMTVLLTQQLQQQQNLQTPSSQS